ncbi:ribbon-helix-helix protein, CopG family [Herbiconiux sp. P16]
MPSQPKTPIRGFRIPSDLYHAAMAKAEREGRTLTDIVREALQRYLDAE